MKEKPYKVKVSVSLDEDTIEIIKQLAEQDDRTFSAYINKVLKDHIKESEAQNS
ncbi:ribbon-helix-helix domain-containing protein [Agathobacter ruminis]|uniref:Toxin-antitoxin system protein n=1 Tax=Agathobacter ruminis TaxID=1712665 RepID=A0A2G3E3K7_9FIRM|nr:toxin-antitoxin system protein [Agathobacter ruminis]MDC7301557.1 toxin-antitoxin system protein [Agathobacter ruminis]PHU37730.1 toxin-antitoxin system protein [Agathobacter ruminis]